MSRPSLAQALRRAGHPSTLAAHPLAALEIARYHRGKALCSSGLRETPESIANAELIHIILASPSPP